jgi:selenophosphate synthetase-related protein
MAGGDVTCDLQDSGARCSGSNRLGQLGLGTAEPVTTPSLVSLELGAAARADAGDGCTCFLARDGVLGCVGANNFGQLGTGDTSTRAVVRPVDGSVRFARVAVGATHVCAISRSARLYCWGNNFYGQLGVGDTGPRRAPMLVGLEGVFRDVAVGGDHTCAIRDEGELLCFGNGNTGQLGDGGNAPRSIAVSVGEGYAQLSAAFGTTCAVRLDGGLDCWGGNLHGQLGVGDTMLRRVPTRVGEGYVRVAVGAGHTCAARADGSVLCFGENDDGELGRSASADALEPVEVEGLAGVVRVEGHPTKALAFACDVNPRYCEADPFEGGKQAIAECWRNLTATGALPLAATDNLNFGNPERPEIMGQLVAAIKGIGEACRALDFPIVSGNVSLYNETNGKGILPTPAIGGVGLIDDWSRMACIGFAGEGECILLVGAPDAWGTHLGQSAWLRDLHGRREGPCPPVDLAHEKRVGDFVRGLIHTGKTTAVHDCSDGGLAVALAEMAMASGVGAEVNQLDNVPLAEQFFGEDQGRYVVTIPRADLDDVLEAAGAAAIFAPWVGITGGKALKLGASRAISVEELHAAHESWFPSFMDGKAA